MSKNQILYARGRYCTGNFETFCHATKTKAQRLINWWRKYEGKSKVAFARFYAKHTNLLKPKEFSLLPLERVKKLPLEHIEYSPLEHQWIDPKSIVLDAGTQSRTESAAKIEEYAEMMLEGIWNWKQTPLIVLYADGDRLYPSDGHHRIKAAIISHRSKIFVEIRQGTLRDALWESLASNKFHGLSLSSADKRERLRTIFKDPEWSSMSDRTIASHCGVSTPTVGKIRAEFSNDDAISFRKGKDGRMRLPPSSASKKAAIKKTDEKILQELTEESIVVDERSINQESYIIENVQYLPSTIADVSYPEPDKTLRPEIFVTDDPPQTDLDRRIFSLILELGAKNLAEQALLQCEESEVREISRDLVYQLQLLDTEENG